jgi:hypothetical protein
MKLVKIVMEKWEIRKNINVIIVKIIIIKSKIKEIIVMMKVS